MRELVLIAILVLLSVILLVTLYAIMTFDRRHLTPDWQCRCEVRDYYAPSEGQLVDDK